MHFCTRCNQLGHSHRYRGDHNVQCIEQNAGLEPEGGSELERLSVICIETSHYVCFTRSDDRWIFMDSMADRIREFKALNILALGGKYISIPSPDDTYNIPKGVDVTHLLNEWVYSDNEEHLKHTPVRKLPEYVRRFTQDIYMCIYIQPDYDMYQ